MKRLFTTHKIIITVFSLLTVLLFVDSCKKDSPVINKPPPPNVTITGVKPDLGKSGDTVFIIGTNFNLSPSMDTVKFNGIAARVEKATSDTLFVIVPAGNINGVITVNGIPGPSPDFMVLLSDSADVYVGGSGISLTSNHQTAQYWKNGIPVILSDGKKNETTCGIIVSGSDIYLAGNQSTDSSAFPEYWKNGTSVIINEPNSKALSLAVSGSDVYVAGEINNSISPTTASVAAYWKNGTTVKLTDGSNNAYATGISVSGNDVYVCGVQSGGIIPKNIPRYWKNGTAVILTDGTTIGYASSIGVKGNDVYVTGFEQDANSGIYVAKYWKNGVGVNLSDGTETAYANSIFISGNDIYIAGIEKIWQAMYLMPNIGKTVRKWNLRKDPMVLAQRQMQFLFLKTMCMFLDRLDIRFIGKIAV